MRTRYHLLLPRCCRRGEPFAPGRAGRHVKVFVLTIQWCENHAMEPVPLFRHEPDLSCEYKP